MDATATQRHHSSFPASCRSRRNLKSGICPKAVELVSDEGLLRRYRARSQNLDRHVSTMASSSVRACPSPNDHADVCTSPCSLPLSGLGLSFSESNMAAWTQTEHHNVSYPIRRHRCSCHSRSFGHHSTSARPCFILWVMSCIEPCVECLSSYKSAATTRKVAIDDRSREVRSPITTISCGTGCKASGSIG